MIDDPGRPRGRDDARAIVIRHNHVPRDHGHAAAGDGNIDSEWHQSGLGMKVRRRAAQPKAEVVVDDLADFTDAEIQLIMRDNGMSLVS